MKYNIFILFLIFFSISGCRKNEDSDLPVLNKDTDRVIINDTNIITVYDTVKIPVTDPDKKTSYTKNFRVQQDTDYVPPRNGGVNKYWYGNRNRRLSNDSNCYFGKGKGNRYRYRWGQQNR